MRNGGIYELGFVKNNGHVCQQSLEIEYDKNGPLTVSPIVLQTVSAASGKCLEKDASGQ